MTKILLALGASAGAILSIWGVLAKGPVVIDHLQVAASDMERQQKQIDGLYEIAEQGRWDSDFNICMRREQNRLEIDEAIAICRQEANEKQDARRKGKK